MDEAAHPAKVQSLQRFMNVDPAGVEAKAIYLTGGDLVYHALVEEKSAEVVLVAETSRQRKT